ncbi:MAG: TorF family putative porin [Pseudomonadota bacterium]
MKKMTSTLSLAAAVTLAMATLAAPAAFAQTEPAAATPDNVISYNAAITSDYRYRGLSQTRLKPALQGGVDFVNNPTGFYVGAWASTIKWTNDFGGGGNVEIDVYAGKRGEITKGVTYDVGALAYWYPENDLNPNANTFEVYGQVGFGPAYVKYSHSTTNLFGTSNSKGSGYLDIGANIELMTGLTLNLHAGRQNVNHNDVYTYNDYKIGVTKDVGSGAMVSLAAVKTNTEAYLSPVNGKNLGKSGVVLSISKTF